jgi:hypothetical protein
MVWVVRLAQENGLSSFELTTFSEKEFQRVSVHFFGSDNNAHITEDKLSTTCCNLGEFYICNMLGQTFVDCSRYQNLCRAQQFSGNSW